MCNVDKFARVIPGSCLAGREIGKGGGEGGGGEEERVVERKGKERKRIEGREETYRPITIIIKQVM